MNNFQRGQIIKVDVDGHSRYKPDDKIIVLIPNGEVKFQSLHDRYGAKYMMVTKLEYFEIYKSYSPDELLEIWRKGISEENPIFVFDHKEFTLYPIGNAQNARVSLEVME